MHIYKDRKWQAIYFNSSIEEFNSKRSSNLKRDRNGLLSLRSFIHNITYTPFDEQIVVRCPTSTWPFRICSRHNYFINIIYLKNNIKNIISTLKRGTPTIHLFLQNPKMQIQLKVHWGSILSGNGILCDIPIKWAREEEKRKTHPNIFANLSNHSTSSLFITSLSNCLEKN